MSTIATRKAILIVDDNAQHLYVLQTLLHAHGYHVTTASNGAEGLASARADPPDIIVSDVLMPVMDGYTLCRQCKLDSRLRAIPFVFYTGEYTDDKDQALAHSLGVKRFIVKPVEPDKLITTLEEVLAEPASEQTTRAKPAGEEHYFKNYNKALARKLEEKMAQTETANLSLLGLQQACAAITSSLGLDEVLQRIARGAIDSLHSNAVWILVVTDHDNSLSSKVLLGVRDGHILALEDALGLVKGSSISLTEHNWLSDAVLCKTPFSVPDISRLEPGESLPKTLFDLAKIIDFHSLLIQPMLARGDKIVGLIILARPALGAIADGEKRLITAFAHQAAIAIENAQLFNAIERSEQYYRTVLESSADAIFVVDAMFSIATWNTGAEQIFAYSSAEIIGQPLAVLFPDTLKPELLRVLQEACGKGKLRAWRTQPIDKHGRSVNTEVTITHVGAELGFTVIVTDISERLQQEAQLLHAQKMEAMGQLVGGIAHDFNNLLTIILGNLKLLHETISNTTNDDTIASLEDALSAGLDGAQLTRQLLAFARHRTLTAKPVAINDLITECNRLLRRALSGGIEIHLDLDESIGPALLDGAQLESALLNLCINARDAMPDGGEIFINTARRVIDHYETHQFDALEPGPYIVLSVRDTGSGMPPEVLERACEPFFTTKEAGKGSGLGLSSIYGFVKQSKGDLIVESEPNKGTKISLLLPEAQAKQTLVDSHEPQHAILPSGAATILLVEDDARIRRYASRCLKELGYQIVESANAAQAIEILQTDKHIDLLFSDIMMPGMDGRALALWCQHYRPAIKVLLTTGFEQDLECNQSGAKEIFSVLPKPYSKAELAHTIHTMLR